MIDLDETIEEGGLKLEFYLDDDPENPRKYWDEVGIMACFHNRYSLGDKTEITADMFSGWDEMENYIIKKLKAIVVLPLYLYDHSGITMSTSPFACKWDSGQVGFIYATRESVKKLMGWPRISAKRLKKVEEILQGEVKEYDAYLTGEVYGWRVKNEYDDVLESCCGYLIVTDKDEKRFIEEAKEGLKNCREAS